MKSKNQKFYLLFGGILGSLNLFGMLSMVLFEFGSLGAATDDVLWRIFLLFVTSLSVIFGFIMAFSNRFQLSMDACMYHKSAIWRCVICKNECDSEESYLNHTCQGMSDEELEEVNRCDECGLIREECTCPLEDEERSYL